MNSLRATAAPLFEFGVGGSALLPCFRHDFASLRHVCAGSWRYRKVGNRRLEGPKSTPGGTKIHPSGSNTEPRSAVGGSGGVRSVDEWPKSSPRAAQDAASGPQEGAKRGKLAAKRVPKDPLGASQGGPEGPRGTFSRSERQKFVHRESSVA